MLRGPLDEACIEASERAKREREQVARASAAHPRERRTRGRWRGASVARACRLSTSTAPSSSYRDQSRTSPIYRVGGTTSSAIRCRLHATAAGSFARGPGPRPLVAAQTIPAAAAAPEAGAEPHANEVHVV
ncbi:hypothetical protein EDB85DRAFT_2149749 [Lactarius pseudohatsudake]|nr:hypothetical protein EDB85DRAFT_2149749 [Lactarius pseudohatsudake]